MRIGSLFSGTGGLDMGVQAVLGGEVVWNVEYDKAPSQILAHHWPDVHNYGDVTTVDWATVPPVDAITAGYPCQPFSIAGKRKGANDARHLWPYVLDAIRHLRPRVVILENVRGHLTLGFGRVLGDLAESGYDARWVCLPAAAAGAPHRRERVFILAHPRGDEPERWGGVRYLGSAAGEDEGPGRERQRLRDTSGDSRSTAPDAAGPRRAEGEDGGSGSRDASAGSRSLQLERARGERVGQEWGTYAAAIERWESVLGRSAPAPTVDGRLSPEFVEWMMGLPAGHVTDTGITRAQQLKALGNGVVPQQASLALSVLLSHNA